MQSNELFKRNRQEFQFKSVNLERYLRDLFVVSYRDFYEKHWLELSLILVNIFVVAKSLACNIRNFNKDVSYDNERAEINSEFQAPLADLRFINTIE